MNFATWLSFCRYHNFTLFAIGYPVRECSLSLYSTLPVWMKAQRTWEARRTCGGNSTWMVNCSLTDFMTLFTMGTGGHYFTMLPADWSIPTSHDPLPSSCHSEKMLWTFHVAHDECHAQYFRVHQPSVFVPIPLPSGTGSTHSTPTSQLPPQHSHISGVCSSAWGVVAGEATELHTAPNPG